MLLLMLLLLMLRLLMLLLLMLLLLMLLLLMLLLLMLLLLTCKRTHEQCSFLSVPENLLAMTYGRASQTRV